MASYMKRNVIFAIILISVISLAIKVISARHINSGPVTKSPSEKINPLPEDVDVVVKGYSYSEINDDIKISISGKEIVRRGKKVLGLRSNLVKANFLQGIKGAVKTPKGELLFSASDAIWDADPSHPLLLTKNVFVALHDKTIRDVKSARVYFKQKVIAVNSDRSKVYDF
jgi:hypothetical protein